MKQGTTLDKFQYVKMSPEITANTTQQETEIKTDASKLAKQNVCNTTRNTFMLKNVRTKLKAKFYPSYL